MNRDQTPTKPAVAPTDKPAIAPVNQAQAQTQAATRVEPQGTPITAPAAKA